MEQTTKKYMLAEHTIGPDDINSLVEWLRGDPWLTQGALVAEFEAAWARWLGTRFAVYCNSGSSANLLMYYVLLASGRLPNRKVVVPAVSWATTVAPAIQFGFEPIMCDADEQTYGLNLAQLEEILRAERPAAVIMVHVLGVPNDMDGIEALRQKYNFVLMEDACAATGSLYKGQKVGTFGALSSFSFFYGHHLSTIEGGMVCTNDAELYELLLMLRSHGWAKDIDRAEEEKRAKAAGALEFNRPFTFYYAGFNLRSSDLNAHIGLSQLKKADRVVARRAENHLVYQGRFNQAQAFSCQRNDQATISSISFAGLAQSAAHREAVGRKLRANGIETRPLGGGNMSRQPFWSERYGSKVFPMADQIHDRSFQLPNHPGLAAEDIEHICDVVLSVPPPQPLVLIEEARWLGEKLLALPADSLNPILNLGSSTEAFRTQGQPWIEEYIFGPARASGFSVRHVDMQSGAGIDMVGDLTDAGFLATVAAVKPRGILCCNLLEHVRQREPVCQAVASALAPGGYLFATCPYRYPYHLDPIDTMFRPSVGELAACFPGLRLVAGDVVRCGTYLDSISRTPTLFVKTFIRLLRPFRAPDGWWTAVCHLPWMFREFQVTCVVLRKDA